MYVYKNEFRLCDINLDNFNVHTSSLIMTNVIINRKLLFCFNESSVLFRKHGWWSHDLCFVFLNRNGEKTTYWNRFRDLLNLRVKSRHLFLLLWVGRMSLPKTPSLLSTVNLTTHVTLHVSKTIRSGTVIPVSREGFLKSLINFFTVYLHINVMGQHLLPYLYEYHKLSSSRTLLPRNFL